MAPVMAGKCPYTALKDGTLDLADIALLNDALAVEADNREIVRRTREAEHG